MGEKTERIKAHRCASSWEVHPGRTHWCRFTKGHLGPHFCVCSIAWKAVSK